MVKPNYKYKSKATPLGSSGKTLVMFNEAHIEDALGENILPHVNLTIISANKKIELQRKEIIDLKNFLESFQVIEVPDKNTFEE